MECDFVMSFHHPDSPAAKKPKCRLDEGKMCAMKCTTVTGNFQLFNNLCMWSPVDGFPISEIIAANKSITTLRCYCACSLMLSHVLYIC